MFIYHSKSGDCIYIEMRLHYSMDFKKDFILFMNSIFESK